MDSITWEYIFNNFPFPTSDVDYLFVIVNLGMIFMFCFSIYHSKNVDKYITYRKCACGVVGFLFVNIIGWMYVNVKVPASQSLNRELFLSVDQATSAKIVHCTANIEEMPKTRQDVETLISCLRSTKKEVEENVSRGKEVLQNHFEFNHYQSSSFEETGKDFLWEKEKEDLDIGDGTFSNPLRTGELFRQISESENTPLGHVQFDCDGKYRLVEGDQNRGETTIDIINEENQWIIESRYNDDGEFIWRAAIEKSTTDDAFPTGPWLSAMEEIKMLHIPTVGWLCLIDGRAVLLRR